MGSKRVKVLLLNDKEQSFDFGTYALIMYYSKQLNPIKAKKLFDSTLSEYSYRTNYDLPMGSLTDDDQQAHFNLSDIQEVILFIENEILPAISNETRLLFLKYGSKESFINSFDNETGFLEEITIYPDEYFEDNPAELAYILTDLKEFFQYVISINQAYEVFFD